MYNFVLMWTNIIESFDKYSVNEYGIVQNNTTGKIMTPELHYKGYHRVMLMRKHYFCHRLCAIYYVPNPENKATVNHNDGIKLNNYYMNLSWMSILENNQHAIDNGLSKVNFLPGSLHTNSKLTEDEVLYIRQSKGIIPANELANKFNVALITIYKILDGSMWKHILIS